MQPIPLAALLAGLIAGFVSAPAWAQSPEPVLLEEILVSATRIATPDTAAPYASEVHTRAQIERSGAATLYDYLAQNTSLQVLPSYGNRFTPKLDMRGYGIGDGYQNIVVTLDGRRLNNIDGVPQLLGAIPLADIDRIEITRGSGSVMFGDGAAAGSIQIYSRPHNGVSVRAALGNHGDQAGTVTAGKAGKKFTLSATGDYAGLDGYSDPDVTGHRDNSSSHTWRGSLESRPVERLKLDMEAASTRIDTRYVSYLTLAQFQANPAQVGSNLYSTPPDIYNRQVISSDLWRLGGTLDLARDLSLVVSHNSEDKLSDYGAGWHPSYDYKQDELALNYRGASLAVTAGVQAFSGMRIGTADRTGKDNTGWYLQSQYRLDRLTLSGGVRTEQVKYVYLPDAGAALNSEHRLGAWDIGMNRGFNEGLSVFANYNRSFQAPDIDRFFTYDFTTGGYAFNTFIAPARIHTLTLGLNHVTATNRLKLSVFHAKLENEIYFYQIGPWSGFNTNLDKTHKYGLELQDYWRVADAISLSLNYTYTRAIIDREDQAAGAYNGKDLPGVPRHGLVLGGTWTLSPAASLSLTHTWRGACWAAGDFDNNNLQRQAAYRSTDAIYRYRHKNLEWFTAVSNLFAHKNGLWTDDDVIYPVDFTRNWRVGMRADF